MGGTLQKVTVNRSSQKELDMGIAELEERGYELKSTHAPQIDRKHFNYARRGHGTTFDTCTSYTRHIAVMTRVWHG